MKSTIGQPLRIITTGGTFEKTYDPLKGALSFGDSHLDTIVAQARVHAPMTLQVLMLIDSLDMQAAHREQVLAACRAADEANIVIVHGTDTMTATAQLLGTARLEKTIVLTGAMVPFEVQNSDASFNLGFALAAATLARPGVYVAMNAQLFAWDHVKKNRELGRFEQA